MTWIRSRRCESHGCAEVMAADGYVHLRSSLHPDQVAVLDPDEWAGLVAGVKDGDFDCLGEVTL